MKREHMSLAHPNKHNPPEGINFPTTGNLYMTRTTLMLCSLAAMVTFDRKRS